MGFYYKYVNGHVLYTENSEELKNQALSDTIVSIGVCKNCGMSGSNIDKFECQYKDLQKLDTQLEVTMESIRDAEKIVIEGSKKRKLFKEIIND